jgi:hypothetical protein
MMRVAAMVLTCKQVGKVKICDGIGNWKIGNRAGDLFNAIRRHQLVHWFDLQGCMLGNDRVRKGLEAMQTVKALETLDLQDNQIDRACLPAIADFLRFSNVRELYLQGNPLQPSDFDELEKVVSKLGRECTVYCYKNKDQPTRKLICTTVRQAGGVDESLSFSSAQLNGIFQKCRERDVFLQAAAAADEITYSHSSRKNSERREDARVIACSTGASGCGDVHERAAADADASDASESCRVDALHLNLQPSPQPPVSSDVQMQPSQITSLLPGPHSHSPAPTHKPLTLQPSRIDDIVAMGFERDAVEVAYAKSGQDMQVYSFVSVLVRYGLTLFVAHRGETDQQGLVPAANPICTSSAQEQHRKPDGPHPSCCKRSQCPACKAAAHSRLGRRR